jgi:hypothetical protein
VTVRINNNALLVQPTGLGESLIQIQTDQMSINGSLTRNRINQKKQADMNFTIMSPADYQTTVNYFTTGSGVYYSNDQSSYGTFTFSGLPSFSESQYVPGASLFRPLTVTIREA